MHAPRHFCAALLFTLDVDAAEVQRTPRHSSVTATCVEVIERPGTAPRTSSGTPSGKASDEEPDDRLQPPLQ